MARKKVNLAWIPNDATRRATLKKRRKSLLKKVNELSTLCDVKACAIIYEPHVHNPEIWPSEPEAKEILHRFKSMPEIEQCKKRVDREGFLRQRILKTEEQIRKQRRDNQELDMMFLMHEYTTGVRSVGDVALGHEEVVILERLINEKMKAVHEKIGEKIEEMKAQRGKYWNPNPNPSDDQQMVLFGSSYGGDGGLGELMQPNFDFGGNTFVDPLSSLYT